MIETKDIYKKVLENLNKLTAEEERRKLEKDLIKILWGK